MIRAVVPPTVPWGTERVRVCLHAGNTLEEVERLVRVLEEWCDKQIQGCIDEQEVNCTDRARL